MSRATAPIVPSFWAGFVFQDFALVNGTWLVSGQPVKPSDIQSTALLTIEGELDDISGAGQTQAAHDLCTGIAAGRKHHYNAEGAGHYGIFSGRRWRDRVYPRVRSFIVECDQAEPGSVKPVKSSNAPARPQSSKSSNLEK